MTDGSQRILAEHLRSIFVSPGCGTTSLRLRNSPDNLAESLALALALAGYEIVPARTAIPGPDTITVNREALADLLGFAAFGSDHESDENAHRRYWAARHRLRAALSESPAPTCPDGLHVRKFPDPTCRCGQVSFVVEPPAPKEQQQ